MHLYLDNTTNTITDLVRVREYHFSTVVAVPLATILKGPSLPATSTSSSNLVAGIKRARSLQSDRLDLPDGLPSFPKHPWSAQHRAPEPAFVYSSMFSDQVQTDGSTAWYCSDSRCNAGRAHLRGIRQLEMILALICMHLNKDPYHTQPLTVECHLVTHRPDHSTSQYLGAGQRHSG